MTPLPAAPIPSGAMRDRAIGSALQLFERRHGVRRAPPPAPRRFVIRRHQTALAASLALVVGGPLTYMVARERAVAPPPAPRVEPAKPVEVPLPEVALKGEIAPAARDAERVPPPAPKASEMAPPPPPSAPIAVLTRPMPARSPAIAPRTRAVADLSQMQAMPGVVGRDMRQIPEPSGRDRFAGAPENGAQMVKEHPVSTFSIDVDTASYSFARASLARGVLPRPDSVRTEEMINYFPYAYEGPASAAEPFRTHVAVFPSPWNEGRKLVRIGIKGYAIAKVERPRANLVFLVDTSGSMDAPNRLPLVKQSLAMLLDQLDGRDRVAIVTYAGSAGTALEPIAASEKAKILAVIDGLGAGGSTAGGEGIRQAYALAARSFDKEAVNRVVLATDGDFNVGIQSREELKGFVERERARGIFLSVLGFGMGNYNDALMQTLAQNGNGAAAYIDTLAEARKVLVEEATSTLVPIAKDVKIQVEFNPATVSEYRLVGYETRLLAREDFANDKVDAGDVGSGQSVTALYEIVPAGSTRSVAELRYEASQATISAPADERRGEYGFVKMRYKMPASETSTMVSAPITVEGEAKSFDEAPQEARFATAVAAFGELLRGGKHTGRFGCDDIVRVAQGAKGDDPYGYRAEFVNLVRAAKTAASLEAQRR